MRKVPPRRSESFVTEASPNYEDSADAPKEDLVRKQACMGGCRRASAKTEAAEEATAQQVWETL